MCLIFISNIDQKRKNYKNDVSDHLCDIRLTSQLRFFCFKLHCLNLFFQISMGYEPLFQCVSCISFFSFLAVVDVYPGVGAAVEAGQQHDDGEHWTCERKRCVKLI